MLVALGCVFMILGAVFEVVDLSMCALASLLVVFAYLELGSPYTWLIWLCTSLVAMISFFASPVWIEYFFVFGIYPIIKAYIERLPRAAWLPLKLVFINGMAWVLIFLVKAVTGMPLIASGLFWMKTVAYALINVAFIIYDMFITVMVRLYIEKFRHRFRKFLK